MTTPVALRPNGSARARTLSLPAATTAADIDALARAYHLCQTLAVLHILRNQYEAADDYLGQAIQLRVLVAEHYGGLDAGHLNAIGHLRRVQARLGQYYYAGRLHEFRLSSLLCGCAEGTWPGIRIPACRRLPGANRPKRPRVAH